MRKKFIILSAITAGIALICISAILTARPQDGDMAYIYQDGVEVARLALDGSDDGKIITVSGENDAENVVEVIDGKVHMLSSTCKDKICVNSGWRDSTGTPIVCMPNKIVIDVKGDSDE